MPSPTRPSVKLADALTMLDLEEDELTYNEGQEEGSAGKEPPKHPSADELADGSVSFYEEVMRRHKQMSVPGLVKKGRDALDSRRHNNIPQPTVNAKALFSIPSPVGLSLPFSNFESISSITSPVSASAFVAVGKASSSLSSNDKGRLVSNLAGSSLRGGSIDQFCHDISLDEKTEDDCRVLSDEIAATLPSPVAVVFPFPSDHVNDDADVDIESKEPTEDSVDDGKMSRYINTMATSIAADILKLRHKKLACTLEPSPMHLLVRMPPAGN